ncbi:hypothetical protein DMP07_03455 [Slackia faecicanis]|uniref:Fido domain-containing protein n=1 Tax=Slackia faecicanis TaxID=255723 RepID=A0A3N0AFZ3_9ACTN|nr:hypothetical protein DMP07_03455 [Slackia faecicanis]
MEGMSDDLFARFVAILADESFSEIRRIAGQRPLLYSEFRTLPLPDGVTESQAWTLLSTLRKTMAVTIPVTDGRGKKGWYVPTKSIAENLAEIDRSCKTGSVLDLAMSSKNATYFLLESSIDDAIESIRGDGMSIGHERARELILEEREPESPEEQLLANVRRIQRSLPEKAHEHCTPELLSELYEQLSWNMGTQTTASIPETPFVWQKAKRGSEESLEIVANIIEGRRIDREEHPLLLAQGIRHIFMSHLPLPAWNGAAAAIAMKLLYLKADLPVLTHVPVMKAQRDWMGGLYRPPLVSAEPKDSETLVDGEVDFTTYVDVYTKLAVIKIHEMEAEFDRVVRRDTRLSHDLQGVFDINHRQRMVLQQALDNPEAVFKIETHRAMNNIAYATARGDLLGLSELGFLRKTRKEHAFVFTVEPDLRRTLSAFLGTKRRGRA